MAASLLRLGRSRPLQILRETLALRGTVVSANLTTKSTKATNPKKKKGMAPGQKNAQPNAMLSRGGKGGEVSVREELVNPTECRPERATARPERATARPERGTAKTERATARPPTQSTTASVPPTALPRQASPTPATPKHVAPVAMPTPVPHTAVSPTSEAEQRGRAEEPPEQQQQQQEEEMSGAQSQAAEKVPKGVPATASAETRENQAELETPPEATQEELDTSTYKNTQHHHYSTMTFLDMEAEMSKYRLTQPSSGRLTPRH